MLKTAGIEQNPELLGKAINKISMQISQALMPLNSMNLPFVVAVLLSYTELLEIAKLLIKAGYAVKIGIEKPKNTNVYFIEYWDEQTKNDT